MTTLDLKTPVGEYVANRPSNSRVFERLGIDYCCGGKTSLGEVCRQKGLDANEVLTALKAEFHAEAPSETDPSQMSLAKLADHIEQTHHARLREGLPRIRGLINKVATAHGSKHSWLFDLQDVFCDFESDMLDHMAKEEQILFPVVRQLEEAANLPEMIWAKLETPIICMEAEHENAGKALESFRKLSGGFSPPHGACNTFKAMLDALQDLEADMHQHVHKENNILFPRALAWGRSHTEA